MVPFDWYYFDISDSSGLDLVVTFHTRPFPTAFDISIVDIFLYRDNHLHWHYFFTLPLKSLHTSEKEIHWNDANKMIFDKNRLTVHAADRKIEVTIEFNTPIPMLNSEFELLPRATDQKSFRWQLRIPRAEARAAVEYDGKQYFVEGTGYHDRNFGTVYLAGELQKWRWGKFYFPDKMMVLGEIVDKQNNVKSLIIVQNGKVQAFEDVPFQWEDVRLQLPLPSGNLKLEKISSVCVDEIFFYTPASPHKMKGYHALRELINFYSNTHHINFVLKKNANARYRRLKEIFLFQDQKVKAFLEEMEFNG